MSQDPAAPLRRYFAGELTAAEAAALVLSAGGLAAQTMIASLSDEERQKHADMMPPLRWEMAKKMGGGRIPDVPYDSPEAKAYMAASGQRFTSSMPRPAAGS